MYTDCRQLQAQGARMVQRTSHLHAMIKAPLGVVDHSMACSVTPHNPLCTTKEQMKKTKDRVTVVNRLISTAQQDNFRSVESVMNRKIRNRDRRDSAVCAKLQDQAGR